MSFFKALTDFFHSLFHGSSGDSKKRQELKRIESYLKECRPAIYKGGLLQANFAEAFNIACVNAKPVEKILSETIATGDVPYNNRFIDRLLFTAFSEEGQRMIDSLSYENRRDAAFALESGLQRHFDDERRVLEKVIRELNSESFKKIDTIIVKLQQLSDVCQFRYVTALHLFDPDYNNSLDYNPAYQPLPPDPLADVCADLYYITKDFSITTSMANALFVLSRLKRGSDMSEREKAEMILHLRKIETVFKKVLTPEVLLSVVRVGQQEPEKVLENASYGGSFRNTFATRLQSNFATDETRIKTELKDHAIASEVKELFGDRALIPMGGYNKETDTQLHQGGASFVWLTPMYVIKNFVRYFYDEKIRALLNDIVIEGFFENPAYKSDFSSVVFACNESSERLEAFEQSFEKGKQNDTAILLGYIRDSSKDADFLKKLNSTVNTINAQVKEIMQHETDNFAELYKMVHDILLDVKKTNPDTISNIKVLFNSSRNKENSTKLENEYPQWRIFLDIMKNYVLVGELGGTQ